VEDIVSVRLDLTEVVTEDPAVVEEDMEERGLMEEAMDSHVKKIFRQLTTC